MKLKARDIIPGWPRSKSTMPCHSSWMPPNHVRFWYRFRHWEPAEVDKVVEEHSLSLEYHDGQAAMLDHWWREMMEDLRIDAGLIPPPLRAIWKMMEP